MDQVAWARDLAERLLAEPLPRRWSHVEGVGHKAESIAYIVGDDAQTLVCAAWLHDIGYAPDLAKTGLHALDGARYLRDTVAANGLLCRLVAHHSYAAIEARTRGLLDVLSAEFPEVNGLVAHCLTYCDMTTSPDGAAVDVESRLNEILTRYGDGDVVAESIRTAGSEIRRSVRTVAGMLASHSVERSGPGDHSSY